MDSYLAALAAGIKVRCPDAYQEGAKTMITISADTWTDLHSNAASPVAREEIPVMLRRAVEAGIPVWLTDEDGKKLKQARIDEDGLNIDPQQNS